MLSKVGLALLVLLFIGYGCASTASNATLEDGVAYVYSGGELLRTDGHVADCNRLDQVMECGGCAEWLHKAIVGTITQTVQPVVASFNKRIDALENPDPVEAEPEAE